MIFLKTSDEIELLRQANLLVGKALAEVAKIIEPGVTTKQLDKVAEEFIRDNGAIPTFKGYPNYDGTPFPGSICASVNDVVVHGIPNDVPLKEGDIISVDCGTKLNGFCGDSPNQPPPSLGPGLSSAKRQSETRAWGLWVTNRTSQVLPHLPGAPH